MDKKQRDGLSQKEAEKILKEDGFNELPSQKKQSWFSIFLKVISEPMLILLVIAGVIHLFLGEIKDSLMLSAAVFGVIGITFYQERKTEKTLDALRDLSSPRALVLRGGEHRRIPGKEVVKGDIIIVQEGDRVPADAEILFSENLFVDESLLTGESVPVEKLEKERRIFSGTVVIGGRATAKVFATGVKTEMGKIGKSLAKIKEEKTLLQKETNRLVRLVGIIGIVACLLIVFYYTFAKGEFIAGLLAGITLSMAMLPEEFPVVLVIFLALGAWRISKKNVLARRASAIETLGAATVLCADKTGTLTMNKMELSVLHSGKSSYEISKLATTDLKKNFEKLLESGILASRKDPFDPVEKELVRAGNLYLKETPEKFEKWELVRQYDFTKGVMAMSNTWKKPRSEKLFVSCKGAPESVLELCKAGSKQKNEALAKVKEMSEKGMRVLAAACAEFNGKNLPESQEDFNFKFLGLLGFIDPPRESTAQAVKSVYEAGMRVIMITGDYPGTAQYVAKTVGIKNSDEYLTGQDLKKMGKKELAEKIKTVNIFSRIVPEQKLLIVEALKENNEIVAMTGDGVNDAPALKAAHIGVAMGERGTDVAREASSLVLLNDDFFSIVESVRMGRRIYNNLKRSMGYLLAIHVPIAGMSVVPLFMGLPPVLLPAHIAFMELIIDPACSTVFESEKEDSNIMQRPPRKSNERMFNSKTVLLSLAQGFGVLLATFVLYLFAVKSGASEEEARSFGFSALVVSNLALIAINLSWKQSLYRILLSGNNVLFFVAAGALSFLGAVLYVPALNDLFYLAPLGLADVALIGVAVLASLGWFEAIKFFRKTA